MLRVDGTSGKSQRRSLAGGCACSRLTDPHVCRGDGSQGTRTGGDQVGMTHGGAYNLLI